MNTVPSNSVGPVTSPDTLVLHVVSQTSSSITLGWTPPAGIVGYEFFNGPTRSTSFDPTKSSVKFSKKAGALLQVIALKRGPSGSYQL
jgi:hypothetical protein